MNCRPNISAAGYLSVPDPATDARAFRNAIGCFPTGVAIITTRRGDGTPVGVTVNSLASVSLEPPLLLWSLASSSPNLGVFRAADHFCVNVLAESQVELSRRFSTPVAEKFADCDWTSGYEGLPLISGAVARFCCATSFCNYGGDHMIFIGRVLACEYSDTTPLLFTRGSYGAIEAEKARHE